ncbi:CBS domain-containing protein [Marinomonas spartinae]|uniref:CBS domain-containing protein n=1 Tax=Marinomonas spartinae TaxID=1792290 RepID=UPI0018F1FB15|nr:CBS domain-containing protein [Marinomonas spartinae]MBJ7554605.1 CBS domain-containing protein [Marinomonas spartinae]
MKEKTLLVKDVMSRGAFFVHPETSITQCVLGLAQHKLSGAPVADNYGQLIGFVSEQDMLPSLVQSAYYCDEPRRVGDVMQSEVLTVNPNDHVLQVAKLMVEAKPKIYPVIEDNRLIGIITRRQVTKALIHSQEKCVPV